MPHDPGCEMATEPECDCECGGRLHGVGMGRPTGAACDGPGGVVLLEEGALSNEPATITHAYSGTDRWFTFKRADADRQAKQMFGVPWNELVPKEKDAVMDEIQKTRTRLNIDGGEADRIPIQSAGGRADTRFNRGYWAAPEYGIHKPEDRKAFAERKSRTQATEDVQYKKNVRAWVGAAKDALRSGDHYRIAETARETPYTPPGSEGITEHLGVSQHLAQANVEGQYIEQSIATGNKKRYQEHRGEFSSIVATIDAQTAKWHE